MRRIDVIGNPTAGRGDVHKQWDDLLAGLRSGGGDVRGEVTREAGHAIELARAAREAGAELVVAVGGDGTVHEVVNGLLSAGPGPDVPALGVVPAGSGCDYAKTFELPVDIPGAVARLNAPTAARIVDAGEIRCRRGEAEEVRYFANIAEVGIGPEVVARASRLPRFLGPAMYFAAFWISLPRYERREANIRMDAELFEGSVMDVVVAIGQVFGGGMRVAPQADPSDGRFDVQVHHGSKLDYVGMTAKVYRGTHLPHARIREARAETVEVTCTPRGLIEADGEILGHTPATFRVLPGALRLKV